MHHHQTKMKSSPYPENQPILQMRTLLTKVKYSNGSNVRTQKYFQYAIRIPYLPHLSAAKQRYTFAQQNHANYLAKKYSKYCNASMSKVWSALIPSPEITLIIGGAAPYVLSAPNKPHHEIHQVHNIFLATSAPNIWNLKIHWITTEESIHQGFP